VNVEGLGLKTAAQIYAPGHVIGEIASPLVATWPNGNTATLTFATARASVKGLSTLPDRVSVVVSKPRLTTVTGHLSMTFETRPFEAAEVQLHMRKGPDGNLDLAASIASMFNSRGDGPQLDLDLAIADAAALGTAIGAGGRLPALLRGRTGELRRLSATGQQGGSEITSGPWSISADGLVSGKIKIMLTDPDKLNLWLPQVLRRLNIDPAPMQNLIATAAATGQSEITVTIRDGNASIGFIPIGTIPPL
jgi:hypothetical protein